MSENYIKDEYLDASANMRHYGNMRFAQLTLFSALTAGLFSILFKGNPSLVEVYSMVINSGGLVITVAFLVMEERSTQYFHHYRARARARELEMKMGFKQHTERPEGGAFNIGIFNSGNTARLLYVFAIVFWVFSIICSYK